ncbi:hypothetical protein [Leucobacter insecticola]
MLALLLTAMGALSLTARRRHPPNAALASFH